MIKFLHILVAVTLLGLSFASCFYMTHAKKTPDNFLFQFTNKWVIQLEIWMILPALTITIVTGSLLVLPQGFYFTTPWIVSAYILLSIALISRCLVLYCLWKQWISTLYYGAQILFWFVLALVMHDAVLHPAYYFWQLGSYT